MKLSVRSNCLARNMLYTLSSRVRKDNLVIFESRQQQAISEQHSKVDALTGLFNRRWLDDSLPPLALHAQTQPAAICVLLLAVYHFKCYNDNPGHHSDDCDLSGVGKTLGENIRPYAYAARYGGEEFMLVLPDCSVQAAAKLVSGICESFSELTFPVGEKSFHVTLSAGVAGINDFESGESALEAADQALYRRKRGGRAGVTIRDAQ